MVDTVRNVSTILQSLAASLRADVRTTGMVIKVMGTVNTNQSFAKSGWVGLYVDNVSYDPRTLGRGTENWRARWAMRVVVQATDAASSENAHARLEKFVKDVLDVVLSDTTLKDNVDALTTASVNYAFSDEDAASLHFEGALITLTFEGRSN